MTRGYFALGLDNPKTPANIGAALRAAHCYGAAFLAASGSRYRHSSLDTPQAWKHTPLFKDVADLRAMIPHGCVPVAVELCEGAESLVDFVHPERAFYIFGAEDQTLGERVLSWCPKRVMIPTRSCMNLAACVNVVLYDRLAKGNKKTAGRNLLCLVCHVPQFIPTIKPGEQATVPFCKNCSHTGPWKEINQ